MIRRLATYLPAVLVLMTLFVVSGDYAPLTTRAAGPYVVTVADDTVDGVCDAHCSLRDAMTVANTDGATDTIEFAIPGSGVKEIVLTSNLPEITTPMRIFGQTQTGASCASHSLTISIVGGGTATQGFKVNHTGAGTGIFGLNIRNINGDAIIISAGQLHGVRCSNIGTNAAGTAASPNTGDGIVVEAGTSGTGGITLGAIATAGDPDDEERNIISGNLGAGIRSSAGTSVKVSGNYIGTNAAGTAAIGNGEGGVIGEAGTGLEIGLSGTNIGVGNLISGNGGPGITLSGVTNPQVQGNIIGLNAAGTSAIPNELGVITSSPLTFIGGSDVADRNVISGNTEAGIVFLPGSASSGSNGNYVGTNAAGTAAIPNGAGISVQVNNISLGNSGANVISGNTGNAINLGPGSSNAYIAGNIIGYRPDGTTPLPNGGNGVEVTSSAALSTVDVTIGGGLDFGNRFYVRRSSGSDPLRNAILLIHEPGDAPVEDISFSGNSIDSDGLGIDLRLSTDPVNSVTQNDDDDEDMDGPNEFTNFPVITAADASVPSISGTFNGAPGNLYTVDFYKSDSCDSATRRIGQVPLGTLLIGTDANGDSVFSKLSSFNAVFQEGDWITATAIGWTPNLHGTSEFSACFEATGAPGLQITQLVPASMPAGSLDFELKAQGSGFKVGDQIRWNGTPLTTNFTSTNELRATISPSTIGSTTGVVDIDVVSTNPAATSNEKQFTIARSSSDVNCDGTATAADALRVLEVLAGLATNGTSCLSDANQNSTTDIADANWIRREVAGLVQPLASFTP